MRLPGTFVWTRFGTEAGQAIEKILARKEYERQRNGGLFLWGIGNNIAPSLSALLKSGDDPTAIFSPIKSKPRGEDVSPGSVAVWRRATSPNGTSYELPEHSLVTSRYTNGKRKHFALVCGSSKPLSLEPEGPRINIRNLVNARSGAKLGYSQVTAIVTRDSETVDEKDAYDVSLRCQLVFPFVITLYDPFVAGAFSEEDLAKLASSAAKESADIRPTDQLSFQIG
ncbi:MAG: hypothetical protein WAU86_24315 [Oricola sp.]